MTRDEAMKVVYAPIQNALETANDQDWCVSHAVDLATEAAATVIQQAFAERDGEMREALEDIAVFANMRSEDDSKTFARVNRGALRTIRDKARQALAAKGDSRG